VTLTITANAHEVGQWLPSPRGSDLRFSLSSILYLGFANVTKDIPLDRKKPD
jgi:hypothetical protein